MRPGVFNIGADEGAPSLTQYHRVKGGKPQSRPSFAPANLLTSNFASRPRSTRQLNELPFFFSPMNYRLFQPDDFDDLYAIEEICFQPPERFTRRYMRHLIASPDAATWIAEQAGTMAGVTSSAPPGLGRMTGFAIVEWAQQISGVMAYIATIEVLLEHRSRGIGAELLRRLEGSANAERAVQIWLHVDPENTPAIQLYERSGYCNSGRADHYYARNRPAAIYVKNLL